MFPIFILKLLFLIPGFRNEADSLLTVTSNTSYNSLRNPTEARRLLNLLAEETSMFEQHSIPPERYLFVLVCTTNIYSILLYLPSHNSKSSPANAPIFHKQIRQPF